MMKENFYQSIEGARLPVSKIVLGMSQKTFTDGTGDDALLDALLELGIQTFDNARIYGKSEENFARWMNRRGVRDKVVLISKCAHPNAFGMHRLRAKDIFYDLKKSQEILQTDYIDIYFLHRDNPHLPVDEMVEALNELHAQGKIGAFGGSNWRYERIQEANEYAYRRNLKPFTVSSPNFSLARQKRAMWPNCITISGKEHEKEQEWYRQNQMPLFSYSSLARGFFSGRVHSDNPKDAKKVLDWASRGAYLCEDNFQRLARCEELAQKYKVTPSQIALCWIFRQGINVFGIVGSSSLNSMKKNIEALTIPLTPEECAYLNLQF